MSLWIIIASVVSYLIGAFMLFSIGVHLEQGEEKPSPIWLWLLLGALWPAVVGLCMIVALVMRFGRRKK